MRHGPRGEPLYSDGRPMWRGLRGEALTSQGADKLLQDYPKRRVADTYLKDRREKVRVSTIFLVLDHRFDDGEPQLYETMVFGGEHDGFQWRYPTRRAARVGHRAVTCLARLDIDSETAERSRRSRMHANYRARWA